MFEAMHTGMTGHPFQTRCLFSVKGYVTIAFGPCPSINGDGKLNKLLGGYSIIMLGVPYEK
jgi:hypothetical protein